MKTTYFFILTLLLINSAFSQSTTIPSHQNCLIEKINNSNGNDALDVKANKFLKKNQILVYFYIGQSDTLSLILNDSLVNKHFIEVNPNRTGDNPDYVVKLDTKNKHNSLLVYFEKDKSSFKISINRKYKIYAIVYRTGVWENCFYVEKRKFFRFS
jgi:hypothetical protein